MQITPSRNAYGGRSRFAAYTPYALALLRVVVGFLFVQHGTAKFFGVPHVAALEGVQLFSLVGVSGVLELVGGLLLLIGLFTRLTAFVLSGEMAVAYFMMHAPHGSPLSPMLNGGEPAVLYCFIFLLIAAAGAGAWSIDGMRGRN
jgi:putative oxidoreductase